MSAETENKSERRMDRDGREIVQYKDFLGTIPPGKVEGEHLFIGTNGIRESKKSSSGNTYLVLSNSQKVMFLNTKTNLAKELLEALVMRPEFKTEPTIIEVIPALSKGGYVMGILWSIRLANEPARMISSSAIQKTL